MKTCKKCGEAKELASFYKHSQMKDGHINSCIQCELIDKKCYRKNNVEKLKKYEKERYKKNGYRWSPDYLKSKEYKNSCKISQDKYKEKYPYRVKCTNIVASKIRWGLLRKEPCLICGKKNSQGHHGDYSKPLDILWLCPKHHMGLHELLIFDEENIRFFDADKIAQDYIRRKKCETKL